MIWNVATVVTKHANGLVYMQGRVRIIMRKMTLINIQHNNFIRKLRGVWVYTGNVTPK
jgi:hypothetical protein